ncbi:MAG: hypothetical protein MJ198_08385 [Bacteroidales bacterium]|nr:hypothetical protein [Bacteroidales bacterium]
MANLDLSSIWNTVLTATKTADNGSLSQNALTDIAQQAIKSFSGTTAKSKSSETNYAMIATELLSLYTKYKSSSDSTEKQAALNVKSISDIVNALGGDKASAISAAASILGGGKSDLLGTIGSLFGKK